VISRYGVPSFTLALFGPAVEFKLQFSSGDGLHISSRLSRQFSEDVPNCVTFPFRMSPEPQAVPPDLLYCPKCAGKSDPYLWRCSAVIAAVADAAGIS
jgi:hypothetical protein